MTNKTSRFIKTFLNESKRLSPKPAYTLTHTNVRNRDV